MRVRSDNRLVVPGLVLLVSFWTVEAAANSDLRTEEIPVQGVELGQAWNAEDSAPLPNRCIEFSPVQSLGQVSSVELSEVEDQSEVMENLDISASASVSTAFGSANASAEFASSSDISKSSTYYSLHAKVQNGLIYVGPYTGMGPVRYNFPATTEAETGPADPDIPPHSYRLPKLESLGHLDKKDLWESLRLTETAQGLIDGSGEGASGADMKAFRDLCGDRFVYAIASGAEVQGIISHTTLDSTSNQLISASLEAKYSGGFASGDVSSTVKTDTETAISNSNLTISFMQNGGAAGILPASQEAFQQKLETLPREALAAPVFTELYTLPYSVISGFNTSEASVAAERGRRFLDRLADQYHEIQTLYDGYLSELNAPFVYVPIHDLDSARKKADDLRSVLHYLDSIFRGYTKGKDITKIELKDPKTNSIKEATDGVRKKCHGGGKNDASVDTSDMDGNQAFVSCLVREAFTQKWLYAERVHLPIIVDTINERLPDTLSSATYYPRVAVEVNVAGISRRACQTNASSPDCLSEAALVKLRKSLGRDYYDLVTGNPKVWYKAISRDDNKCLSLASGNQVSAGNCGNLKDSNRIYIMKEVSFKGPVYAATEKEIKGGGKNDLCLTGDSKANTLIRSKTACGTDKEEPTIVSLNRWGQLQIKGSKNNTHCLALNTRSGGAKLYDCIDLKQQYPAPDDDNDEKVVADKSDIEKLAQQWIIHKAPESK